MAATQEALPAWAVVRRQMRSASNLPAAGHTPALRYLPAACLGQPAAEAMLLPEGKSLVVHNRLPEAAQACHMGFAAAAEILRMGPVPVAFAGLHIDIGARVEARHMAVVAAAGILHRVPGTSALHLPTMALPAPAAAGPVELETIQAAAQNRARRAEARRKSWAAHTAAGAPEDAAPLQHPSPPLRSSR